MKPNNVRLILLVAILMVFMTLYTKYNEMFYTPPKTQTTSENKLNTDQKNQPVPTEALNSPSNASTKPNLTGQTVINRNLKPVDVKTDVLSLEISPDNGDIISAKLLDYAISLKDKSPLSILEDQKGHAYIAQSGVLSQSITKPMIFSSEKSNYVLAKNQNQLNVVLTYQGNGLLVTKTYTLTKGSYDIAVKTEIKNTSSESINARTYNRLTRSEPEKKGGFFDVHSYATYTGAVLSSTENKYQKESFSDISKASTTVQTDNGWVAMVEHYFLSAWIPQGTGSNLLYTQKNANGSFSTGVVQPEVSLKSGQTMTQQANLYVGPALKDQLEAAAPNLSYTIDYGLLWFISVIIFWAMAHIYTIVGNWGLAIILVTLLIKLLFYPLSAKSFRSMAKMRLLQPKIKQLKERLGDDRQKMSQAMMELYRKEKVNPLGGCLPILIQIPVFIGLYWVLLESVQLRQAPFIFWIHDLSQKDPYYVLPILMGLSMLLQQKVNPSPPDPVQARVMMLMPVVFTVMFISFPSGLVLYWLTNNLLTVAQQLWVNHRMSKDPKFAGLKNLKKHKPKNSKK